MSEREVDGTIARASVDPLPHEVRSAAPLLQFQRSAPVDGGPGAAAPFDDEPAAAYLAVLFNTLVENKLLPKYQFERRVDVFLNVFLPEILTTLIGGTFELVVPEFPLKTLSTLRTTNIDHLLRRRFPDGSTEWVFFELKTDVGSIKQDQLATYRTAALRGMAELISDVHKVRNRPKAPPSVRRKYDELLARLAAFPLGGAIRVVFLAPIRVDVELLGANGISLTFSDLSGLDLSAHPEAWRAFRDGVLARAFS